MKLTQYTIEREFAAPPKRLYEAYTKPEQLAAWLWGDLAKACRAEIDLRINGLLKFDIDEGQGFKSAMRGVFLVIVPNKKVIHTMHWDADVGYNRPGNSPVDEVVVLDFEPKGKGTLFRLIHMGIPDDGQSAKVHEQSIRHTLNFLEKLVMAKPAKPAKKRRGT